MFLLLLLFTLHLDNDRHDRDKTAVISAAKKDNITIFLVGSFCAWLLLNVFFFATVDLSYLPTFFDKKTAPQYACELFKSSKDDSAKFNAVFTNRLSYTKEVHADVKEWVSQNIDRWENTSKYKHWWRISFCRRSS